MFGSPCDLVPQLTVRQCETGLGYDGHVLVMADIHDVEKRRHGYSLSSPGMSFANVAQNSLLRVYLKDI